MDENKLRELHRIGYRLGPACGLCVHGRFVDGQAFGTCRKHSYHHGKHSGAERELSVNRHGNCDQFLIDTERQAQLGPGFSEMAVQIGRP